MTIIGAAVGGLTTDLTTSVGQLRLALGDTVYGSGVRPDGSNLSDAELTYFLAQEGNDVVLATALACETLATMWAGQADLAVGPRKESLSQVAQQYAKRAETLRGVLVTGYVSMGFASTGS